MSEETPKYVIFHSFTKATKPSEYAKDKEEFSYTVRGDDMEKAVKDMNSLKKKYPPITHQEKIDKQNSTEKSKQSTTKETLDF